MNSCCNSSAALLGLLLITACTDPGGTGPDTGDLCRSDTTPISNIQGDGYHSPIQGSPATTRGTVTRVLPGAGIYIEDTTAPSPAGRSRALFIADVRLSETVAPGQVLAVSGSVEELGSSKDTLTSLVDVAGHETCGESGPLPRTQASLPLNSSARESLEGMRIGLDQELTVTDVYGLYRGELTLSGNGMSRIPTEALPPGDKAIRAARENRNQSLPVNLGETFSPPLPAGSVADPLTGVMGHDGRGQQLLLEGDFASSPAAADALDPAPNGAIRVVSSNLRNFFNGDGRGGGFPGERGADSHDDFLLQSARIRAMLTRIQPDLLAVQELENDGFGPHSAARSLLDLLQGTGHRDWLAIETSNGRVGNDEIAVGLFYRSEILEPVGTPRQPDSPLFQDLNRQPLAQLFRDRRSGVEFLVVANHLKSKGGCPDRGPDADQRDGQACWNATRSKAVVAQIEWLEAMADTLGTRNILVLGDMNAYRKEDPVRQFRQAGFVDLVEQLSGLPQYSYIFRGQAGTLDYQFATPALASHARAAQIWHINAAYARNINHQQPWLRASDHDPVIVDFDFSQAATSD